MRLIKIPESIHNKMLPTGLSENKKSERKWSGFDYSNKYNDFIVNSILF
jgi:hypothetical protein